MRKRAFTLAMAAVLVVSAMAGPAAASAAAASNSDHAAAVSFSGGVSGGSTVVVDEVSLPDGGFVTIHDDSLTDGETLGSVVGTSAYLEPGTHENVTVDLTDDVDSGTLHAMAHRDTTGDRTYRFVSSNGEADGPYTADGDAVMASAEVTVAATVRAADQPTDGTHVIVDRVELSEGGFVTVHDASLADGAVFESIRGTSGYLEPGTHENVRISLDEPLTEDETVFAMAHRDTNGNEAYDFPASEGASDGPYAAAGAPVMDPADVDVGGMDDQGTDDGEMTDDEEAMDDEEATTDEAMTDEEGTDDEAMDGGDAGPADEVPGFGVVLGLLALVSAALLAARRQP